MVSRRREPLVPRPGRSSVGRHRSCLGPANVGTRDLRLRRVSLTRAPSTIDGGNVPLGVASDAHLVPSLRQAGEQGGVHLAPGNAPSPDGDVRSVPRGALTPDLDFRADQSRRRVHDGGTEVAADVEHDGPHFACPGEMVHGYGATDTGVAAGFL